MFENFWQNILQWFGNRSERSELLTNFNSAAKNAFVIGVVPTLLKARVSKGNRDYKHQFSNWLYSGFRIQAFSGRQLSRDELMKIGQVVLSDDVLVRRLVVAGFDTLEIHGDEGRYGIRYQLRGYMALQ